MTPAEEFRAAIDAFIAKIERQSKCGSPEFPHEMVDRIIVIPPGLIEAYGKEFIDEMFSGMSPKVCKICGRAGS